MVVQSQFISQFGFPQDGAEKYPSATIESLLQETISGEWGTDCSDDSGTKVIRTTNFTNEGVLDLTVVVVRTIDAKKVEKKQLKKGDIILEKSGGTKDNPVGRLVYFEEEGVFLANNFTQVLRPAEDINSRYLFAALYYLYQTHKPLIKGLGNQTNGIQNLKVPQYLQLQISVPDRTAQDDFERICRQADKSKFDGLKSQFIEMFGDTFQNERGWTYKKLPEVSTIVLGSTPSSSNPAFWDGDVKWITPAELSDDSFYLYDSERHITEEGVKSTSLKPFPAGTVILSTRAPIGKTAIAGCEMYCNQGFKNFVCDNTINPVYLFYSLRIHNPELQKMGTGSTFLELSKKAIEQISISVPPKELQDEFEQFYKQADKSKYLS